MFGNFHGMLILSQRSRKYYDILLRIPSEKITAYHSKAKSYKLRKPQLNTLRKKCPYSELFWSAFSRIRIKYGEILHLSVFSTNAGKCGRKADQNNSKYGHFLRSVWLFNIERWFEIMKQRVKLWNKVFDFHKIWCALFLETLVLRFALFPYYRRFLISVLLINFILYIKETENTISLWQFFGR